MDVPSIAIDARVRVAIITWPDVQPALDRWRACFEEVLGHPDFRPDFAVISDRRAVTKSPDARFVRGFLELIAGYVRKGRFRGRWATVVAPSQSAVYGMARMTEILSEETAFRYTVFTDFEEAVAWASRAVLAPSDVPPPR